ncbi:hypothetical protein WJX81_001533 [Elliptochloris bilobata]|uniref:CNNM transmembrane domain-containing protein n=1 Tax=Elliptochloris bilobata TaxID=381761 RepID=A0AAW1QX75_9CHLO
MGCKDQKARTKTLYHVMQSIEGRLGGGEGIEGLYGSVTRTGMQKVLDCLAAHCGLGASSYLVDIGAGLGRPLLHALVSPGVAGGWGVEVDRIKCDKAAAFLAQAAAALLQRGAVAQALTVPHVRCAPVEQVTSLAPATHAYSFWEGIPVGAKCAFGRLFAASQHVQAVAVVQRAMRSREPADVMAELGFGPLEIVGSFAVSMSGSGRSFTAYVFRRNTSLPRAALTARASAERPLPASPPPPATPAAVVDVQARRSLDSVDLEVLRRSGTPQEQAWAARIEPVVRRPHFLLVTLVLCNAACTETLPIFLDRLADPVTAILLSITVVLIFGEIIPQAVCARYGLAVGAYSAWFVQALMALTSPLSYPLSRLLDWVLGSDNTGIFRRTQLKAMLDIHGVEEGLGGDLTADEIGIIRGALDLSHKTAAACMTPFDKVFMLSADQELDEATLQSILHSGHSRIPIHKPGARREVMGLILVKELIVWDHFTRIEVGRLKMRSMPLLRADTRLFDMLRLFETCRCHMALLVQPPGQKPASPGHAGARGAAEANGDAAHAAGARGGEIAIAVGADVSPMGAATPERAGEVYDPARLVGAEPVGIITIEDVIEELIQAEIVDETDQFIDNLGLQRVNATLLFSSLPRHLRLLLKAQKMRVGTLATLKANRQLGVPPEASTVPAAGAGPAAEHRAAQRTWPRTARWASPARLVRPKDGSGRGAGGGRHSGDGGAPAGGGSGGALQQPLLESLDRRDSI